MRRSSISKKNSHVSFLKLFKKKKVKRGSTGNSIVFVFAIVGLTILFGSAVIGRVTPNLNPLTDTTLAEPIYTCCDTGDGEDCRPIPDKKLYYQGVKASAPEEYHLLKTDVFLRSQDHHIDPDPNGATNAEGEKIFYNPRSELNQKDWAPECFSNITSPGKQKYGYDDFIFGPGNGSITNPDNPDYPEFGCYAIPNEQIIYVCKKENEPGACENKSGRAHFDAYFRAGDYPSPGIHDVIKHCVKPKVAPEGGSKQQIINVPNPDGKENLQLETFFIKEDPPVIDWLSPYCKPAIYLYPEEQTAVNVQVDPKGPFTLTIPPYPEDGWNVIAFPDGRVLHEGKTFPYLYWEASLPDKLIKEPEKGYVVAPKDLKQLFNTVLPQAGLNAQESKEFSEYWLKALPESAYYFVGIMPEEEINALAPLTIQPKPDSVLRVTLYFKALDKKEYVEAPQLSSFTRNGFTVIEWGGLFKADKKHKGFTCLM